MTATERIDFRPAGLSDSENEEFDEYDGFYFDKPEKKKNAQVQKSELEQFKENLLDHLKGNNVDELRKELDRGISTGFDIDSEIEGDWNLLYFACSLCLPEVVQFLADERGVCLDTRINGETPLMTTCSSKGSSENVLKVVKILHKMEPKLINRTNYLGENALLLATLSGHLTTVEYLINVGESYDIIANSGRNVMFYAIEGNHIDIAKMLFSMKIDIDIKDCYGVNAKSFAQECNALEILEMFPEEEYKYETPSTHYCYSNIDAIIPDTLNENGEIPSYFPEIISLLRGMDCERFIPLFSQANISLEKFLTINECELEEIGIPLPYQRKIILLGIHKFFKGKWTNKSIYIPENVKSQLTPVDHIYLFANILRQIVILKSQMSYLKRLKTDFEITKYPVEQISIEHFKNFHNLIKELQLKMKKMIVTKRPLLIEKQNHSIEPNAIMKSNNEWKALKVVLPVAIITTIMMMKLFLKK